MHGQRHSASWGALARGAVAGGAGEAGGQGALGDRALGRGEVKPCFETLRELVRACGLDVSYGLVRHDDSSRSLIEESLRLNPDERLERLRGWIGFSVEARESLARG